MCRTCQVASRSLSFCPAPALVHWHPERPQAGLIGRTSRRRLRAAIAPVHKSSAAQWAESRLSVGVAAPVPTVPATYPDRSDPIRRGGCATWRWSARRSRDRPLDWHSCVAAWRDIGWQITQLGDPRTHLPMGDDRRFVDRPVDIRLAHHGWELVHSTGCFHVGVPARGNRPGPTCQEIRGPCIDRSATGSRDHPNEGCPRHAHRNGHEAGHRMDRCIGCWMSRTGPRLEVGRHGSHCACCGTASLVQPEYQQKRMGSGHRSRA
jgi:hypothetical protein